MKTVFDTPMCAHVWAQRSQAHGRGHGSVSFDGDAFFSYTTRIARFHPEAGVVLVTTRHYSPTTSSKHMPAVRRAVGYSGTHTDASGKAFAVLSVDNVSPLRVADHAANIAALMSEYDETLGKAMRARDASEYYANRFYSLNSTANMYAGAFGAPYQRRDIEGDLARIATARAEREVRNNTPAKLRARERAAAIREAKVARRAELANATYNEKLAAWRSGELMHAPYGVSGFQRPKVSLRVRGGNLETTQGASVPLAHAIKVFKFVKLCRERGEGWSRNGHTLRVGHFQVDVVEADGSFKAGCHNIAWNEVEIAARQAGVFEESAADTRD